MPSRGLKDPKIEVLRLLEGVLGPLGGVLGASSGVLEVSLAYFVMIIESVLLEPFFDSLRLPLGNK